MTETQNKGGRPCSIDQKAPVIIEALRDGATYELACRLAGISYRAFRLWMKRGEQEEEGRFFQFFHDVQGALASCEMDSWRCLSASAKGDWKAANAFLKLRLQHQKQQEGQLLRIQTEEERRPKDNVALVDVRTFITSPDYLGLKGFWPRSLELLEQALEPGKIGFILEWGLGGGKSYFSSALLAYRLYKTAYEEVILGSDPREKAGLAADTEITLVNTSLNQRNAKEVVFDVLLGLVEKSPWFKEYLPHNPKVRSRLEFEHNYSIFPATGKISSIVGFHIKEAIQDEANLFEDSTDGNSGVDYADNMYTELHNRIFSRWGDAGYLGLLSARRTVRDFTARKRTEFQREPEVARRYFLPPAQTTWGNWPQKRCITTATGQPKRWRRFDRNTLQWLDASSQARPHEGIQGVDGFWIPEDFWIPFTVRPEEAMRDLASIPSETLEPFFRKRGAIVPDWDLQSPILPGVEPQDWIAPGVRFDELVYDWFVGDSETKYHFHVDPSLNGDATGLGVAYCSGIDEKLLNEADRRPEKAILIDLALALQIKPPSGGEIEFADIRKILYWLRNDRGFRFGLSSYDSWQSVDAQQILRRQSFRVETFSLDRSLMGYSTLKDAVYEGRFFYPPAHGQTPETTLSELRVLAEKGDPYAVLQVELHELELLDGKKVDHPEGGTKDVSDGVAGAVTQVQRRHGAPGEELK